ncbi:hypothetical protein RclHR1_03070001 [Rhizophagus clarus]|uniref:Uncharacterized protein n=1 Tax=Rhizophagus clarus TaxID=94130 RepID=A0A2Z6R6J9_9GLOM|nr:hypothetical protein RclHR1_03070001 [Rhizophagus clarus]
MEIQCHLLLHLLKDASFKCQCMNRPLSTRRAYISFGRSSTSDNNVVLSMEIFTIPPQSNLSIERVSRCFDGSECLRDLDA